MNGSAVAPAAIAEESSASSRSLISPSAIFCELRRAVQHLVTEVMSAHRALVRPFGHSFATGRTLNGVVARRLTFEHRIAFALLSGELVDEASRADVLPPMEPRPQSRRLLTPSAPARTATFSASGSARLDSAPCSERWAGVTRLYICLHQAARRRGRHDQQGTASRRDELCGHAPGESAAQRRLSARADHEQIELVGQLCQLISRVSSRPRDANVRRDLPGNVLEPPLENRLAARADHLFLSVAGARRRIVDIHHVHVRNRAQARGNKSAGDLERCIGRPATVVADADP
jgi:hypothetical protein